MSVTVSEKQRRHGHFINGATTMSKQPNPSCPELTEQELESAVGGAVDNFLQLAGVEGESQDDKKRNHIEIQSFGPK